MDEGPRTIHRSTDEVRGGSTPHVVRWMLGFGLLAVVVLLSGIWIFSAATQEDPVNASTVVQSGAGSDQSGVTSPPPEPVQQAEPGTPPRVTN